MLDVDDVLPTEVEGREDRQIFRRKHAHRRIVTAAAFG